MQTTDQVAGEAREKLAEWIEPSLKVLASADATKEQRYDAGCMVLGVMTMHQDAILAALRAQPERGADKFGIEQIARAMCRHQIHHNQFTWNPREPLSDESVQRAEDAGWQQWNGFAQAVIAAIRALPLHPDKDEGGGR